MPTARASLSTSVMNGRIYAIGGAASAQGPGLSIVEEYDIEGHSISPQNELSTKWGAEKKRGDSEIQG